MLATGEKRRRQFIWRLVFKSQWTAMFNSTIKPFTNDSLSLCFLDDAARDRSSVFYAVTFTALVITAILSPVAVAGNALIMAAIWKNQSLRTPTYVLLRFLAFTDLCTGLITRPFFVAGELICLKSPQKINSPPLFHISAVVITFGCGAYITLLTVSLLTLMAIERWLHMARRTFLTVRRIYFIVAVISLLMIPFAVFHFLRIFNMYRLATVITFFFVFLFCTISTTIAYFKVFQIIRVHKRQIRANEPAHNFCHQAINLEKYKKSVFSMLYILGVFYTGFLPVLLFLGLSVWFSDSQLELVYIVTSLFLFLFSSLNPLIYLWRMSDIRSGVKQLLTKLFCKVDN